MHSYSKSYINRRGLAGLCVHVHVPPWARRCVPRVCHPPRACSVYHGMCDEGVDVVQTMREQVEQRVGELTDKLVKMRGNLAGGGCTVHIAGAVGLKSADNTFSGGRRYVHVHVHVHVCPVMPETARVSTLRMQTLDHTRFSSLCGTEVT